jgi:hypothetical protein
MGTPEGLYHWIPGEMILVLRVPRLPSDDTLPQLVEQVQVQLNEFLAQYGLALELYGMAGRWLSSPGMPPVRRRAFVFALQRRQPLVAIFFHTRFIDARQEDPLPVTLSLLQTNLEQLAQRGLSIISAMPNWLVTAAPLYFAEGGAALPPRPAPTQDVAAAANSLTGWHLRQIDQSIPLDSQDARDVVVAVLDTAPHPDRVRSAASRPELRRNWLLQRLAQDLRNEDGPFVIEYDRYALSNDAATGRDYNAEARYYLMPDHGLSVAGLIRDVAPRAQIRLLRVLNDYGASDLYPLFAALTDLEREVVTGGVRRLVINLSLTIMPDQKRLPYIWFDHRQWPTTQLMGAMRVLNHIEDGLRLLFEALLAHGVLVVAAAGNDSLAATQQNLAARPPRSPARYESTLSVTAVNSSGLPSKFANAANVAPGLTGVATLGGDYPNGDESMEPLDAVRGVYISPTFPDGEANGSGWADWRGTSFSTAIVSGLGAHLMAQGWSATNIITRLSQGSEKRAGFLFGVAPSAARLLANVIRVQQRFGL